MIGKFSRPQFRGDHLSERPTASDTVFTSLCDHSCRGNRAEWTRISLHEPHYTWSRWLGFGLLIYLFPDPLLQLYKLALINCGDISQQLQRSPPHFSFSFPCGNCGGIAQFAPQVLFFVNVQLPGEIRTFCARKGQTAQLVFVVLNGSLLPNHP